MRDPITFARLISQITYLRGSCLNQHDIAPIADTVAELSVGGGTDSVDRLLDAMQKGQKISAIKEYRSLTGMGVKESKDAVEKYWSVREPQPLAAD